MIDPRPQQPAPNPAPVPEGPRADQPKPFNGACAALPPSEPPGLPELEKCPEPPCCCPERPTSSSNCFDELIEQQTREITEAERAKSFKADLEALLDKSNAALKEYTVAEHTSLTDQWKAQDGKIADLLRVIACNVPCWWCVIECHICPLLYAISDLEKRLYGDGKLIDKVYSLYDLLHWNERNREAARVRFERIRDVLAVWESPAKTIQQVLNDNLVLYGELQQMIATRPVEAVYDVFMRLVPRHLAIAPPADSGVVTAIAKEFTEFCECDKGTPDDCCGPDVGVPSLRNRLVKPQPYLIRPDQYFDVICCIVKNRYLPAKDALAKAEGEYEATDAEIKRVLDRITKKKDSLRDDFIADLPVPFDCDIYCGPGTPEGAKEGGGHGGHDHGGEPHAPGGTDPAAS